MVKLLQSSLLWRQRRQISKGLMCLMQTEVEYLTTEKEVDVKGPCI
jgi:hypothetical protein